MKKGILPLITAGAFGTGFFLGGKMLVSMVNDYKTGMKRSHSNMMLLNDWLCFLYSGGCVETYFCDHGYDKIMIYGNGYIGARLLQAMAGSDTEVVAIMDKVVPTDKSGIVIGIDAEIPDVDCIVVTPVYYQNEIYSMLREKTDIPIVSIETVIGREQN